MQEKVSIIVPVYNAEMYLDDCIRSILKQDYDNLEILLVDDGSTDSSAEIAKKYAKKYYNFYFVKKKELGISLRCISINKYFPYAADDCIRSFAVYKKGIFHKIRAFYNLGRLDVGWKSVMKYRLLMLFNKF